MSDEANTIGEGDSDGGGSRIEALADTVRPLMVETLAGLEVRDIAAACSTCSTLRSIIPDVARFKAADFSVRWPEGANGSPTKLLDKIARDARRFPALYNSMMVASDEDPHYVVIPAFTTRLRAHRKELCKMHPAVLSAHAGKLAAPSWDLPVNLEVNLPSRRQVTHDAFLRALALVASDAFVNNTPPRSIRSLVRELNHPTSLWMTAPEWLSTRVDLVIAILQRLPPHALARLAPELARSIAGISWNTREMSHQQVSQAMGCVWQQGWVTLEHVEVGKVGACVE